MSDAIRSESFTVAIPLPRLLRALSDPGALAIALETADAAVAIGRVLRRQREVTIMFGDIEDFTPLTERLGDQAAATVLADHDRVVGAAITEHGGLAVSSAGDGFMGIFDRAGPALRSAHDIQSALAVTDGGAATRVRIGIHVGPVVPSRSINGTHDLVGRSVIIASRIAHTAAGGEVLVSDAVFQAAGPEFHFRNERTLRLKGLAGQHRVAELALPDFHRRHDLLRRTT